MIAARAFVLIALLGLTFVVRAAASASDDFPLVVDGLATPLVIENETDAAVLRAAGDVAADFERVSGCRPELRRDLPARSASEATVPHSAGLRRTVILAGVLGRSPAIDDLARNGRLEVTGLAGAWETFSLQVVEQPFPGTDRALVITGSDRRGAIYGLYELSSGIGVSPWYWWADVAPRHTETLLWPAQARRVGPPSVKYRGVFLNDEDWGLQPWAARTLEPETGNIGPKTYARLFELLLRLRGNTVWPAMHAVTRPFNADPANARLADAYGIVMGSSHAEPMLRNNVGEWKDPAAEYNYLTNREGVRRYWEQRLETNGRYENIYTLGMRGIHDSAMQGTTSDAERIRVLEQIFADQRELLARHVAADVGHVPQMFCAYKEVLSLYRAGLRVPDDVTIVWPDDNFGYVRNFATPAERSRAGGFGIYYHVSYLGRPLSYLWLCTTPPALIWEEMTKAYASGANRIWIVNVGDLKPAEIATEFFLQLAWDVRRWQPHNLSRFLVEWSAREFGPAHADEIGAVLASYHRLNFARKPEHLQWWLPGQPRRFSPLTNEEVRDRLDEFARLQQRVAALEPRIPPGLQDAFFELVHYPVVGAALANLRYFAGERGDRGQAELADAQLAAETRRYNEQIAGGKWRHLMALEPADRDWASMRIEPWALPPVARPPVPGSGNGRISTAAGGSFASSRPAGDAAWTMVPGLGRSGRAVTVLPATAPTHSLADAPSSAPRLDYVVELPHRGVFTLDWEFVPTHPLRGDGLRLAFAVDDGPTQLVELRIGDGDGAWAQGVLDGMRRVTTPWTLASPGPHVLHVYGLEPGVVLDAIVVREVPAAVRGKQ
jgi:hypothetical protein